MLKKIIYFLVVCLLWGTGFAKTAAYFSPSNDCKDHLIALFQQAKKTIDVVIYAFTDNDMAIALEGAHARGVHVRILADKDQADSKNSQIYNLYAAGVPVRIQSAHKIEHNKFALIDNLFLETGSFNWTKSASEANSENCLLLWDEPDTIALYQKRFQELWTLNTTKATDKWFQNDRKGKKK